MEGIILTGWSRYNYFGALCELLPVGLPSLALALRILDDDADVDALRREVFESIGIGDMPFEHPTTESIQEIPEGNFPGADVFRLVGALQGARQLLWTTERDVRHNFPAANGGRRDPARVRRAIENAERAETIAKGLRTPLRRALRNVLRPVDINEFIAVHVNRRLSDARRIRRTAARA
jgi:hexosaminidase